MSNKAGEALSQMNPFGNTRKLRSNSDARSEVGKFKIFSEQTDRSLLNDPGQVLEPPSFSANPNLTAPTDALLEIFRARQQEVLTRRSLGQIRVGR